MTTAAGHDEERRAPRVRLEHPPVAERRARGRDARADVPRSAHAELDPGPDRPDPIALLEGQAKTRVPELVPIRYGRMLSSPFAFYRGAALVMASDLSRTPTTALRVQLCGDAHLSNFGAFGSPERRLVFDINDFDETLPGPFEWDVKRLAASFEVAGRERGFTSDDRKESVLMCASTYRQAMAEFAQQANLEVFYAVLDVDDVLAKYRASLPRKVGKRVAKSAAKSRTKDSLQALARLTRMVDGEPRIVSDPPLVVPMTELLPEERAAQVSELFRDQLRDYRRTLPTDRRRLLERYRFVELAHKVVGVGSVGNRALIALMLGRDVQDPLFLQLKEAQPSVLEPFAGRSRYRNAGHRVVAGQRLMQAAGDVFLGWLRMPSLLDGGRRDYYVRQLGDWKGSADVETMRPESMVIYARLCGWTLARAHARSGDPIAIAAYLGKGDAFDRAIVTFSQRCADRNERDHDALAQAVASGRLVAEKGV